MKEIPKEDFRTRYGYQKKIEIEDTKKREEEEWVSKKGTKREMPKSGEGGGGVPHTEEYQAWKGRVKIL